MRLEGALGVVSDHERGVVVAEDRVDLVGEPALVPELERVPAATRTQRWALQAVREDAAQVRRELAGSVLAETSGESAALAVGAFLAERGDALRRLTAFLRSLSREGEPDLAGLTLAVRQLRTLVD